MLAVNQTHTAFNGKIVAHIPEGRPRAQPELRLDIEPMRENSAGVKIGGEMKVLTVAVHAILKFR